MISQCDASAEVNICFKVLCSIPDKIDKTVR